METIVYACRRSPEFRVHNPSPIYIGVSGADVLFTVNLSVNQAERLAHELLGAVMIENLPTQEAA